MQALAITKSLPGWREERGEGGAVVNKAGRESVRDDRGVLMSTDRQSESKEEKI